MTHFKRIVMNDLLSNVALSAFNIYTIWYLANVVHSQSAVALFGCAGFVEIVLASFGGRMSDRFPRINLIRIGSVARMVALAFLIVMHKMSVSFTAVSVAVGCVLSFVTSFYLPAIETIAPAFSEDDDELIRNNASLNMVQQLATILGSALSGVLVLLKSALVSYGIILVIMVASCVMMLRIPSDSVSREETETDESMLDSLRQVVHLEVIRVLLPYATLINVSFWLYWYLTPMYLARRLPDFKAAYSIQEMTIGITAGVSGFLFSHVVRDASRHLHGYAQWLVLQGVGIALFPLGAVFFDESEGSAGFACGFVDCLRHCKLHDGNDFRDNRAEEDRSQNAWRYIRSRLFAVRGNCTAVVSLQPCIFQYRSGRTASFDPAHDCPASGHDG